MLTPLVLAYQQGLWLHSAGLDGYAAQPVHFDSKTEVLISPLPQTVCRPTPVHAAACR